MRVLLGATSKLPHPVLTELGAGIVFATSTLMLTESLSAPPRAPPSFRIVAAVVMMVGVALILLSVRLPRPQPG